MSEQRAKDSFAVPAEGLFFDRAGRWWHDGTEVRHARLCTLLGRSVARAEDGALMLTTGRDRLPFASEDAPVHARSAEVKGGELSLQLSTGQRWVPPAGTRFFIDEQGRTRVPSPDARFWVLLSRSATQALLGFLVDDDVCTLALPQGESRLVEQGSADWTGPPEPGSASPKVDESSRRAAFVEPDP